VAANHACGNNNNRGGRGRGGRNKKHAPCAVCNGTTKGFVPVFLDLGNEDYDDDGGEAGEGSMKKSASDGGVIDVDGDVLEDLVQEWDCLWNELKTLCGCEEDDDETEGLLGTIGTSSDNDDFIDITVTNRSDQYMADICGAIDLTQHTPVPIKSQRQRDKTQTQSDQAIATELPIIGQTEMQTFEERRDRIQEILKRLKHLHNQMLSISQQQSLQHSSSSPTSNNRQIQRLRSKVKNVQDANAELTSQTKSLQTANADLTSKFERLQQTLLERTIECERVQSKHSTLESDFRSMEDSYRNHTAKSSLVQTSLREQISKLQTKFHKLETKSSLDDVREMDDVRRNYTKMSQEVHDVKAKNARLKNEYVRKEREWEVKYEREKERCEAWKGRVESLVREGGRNGGRLGDDDGSVEEENHSFARNNGKEKEYGELDGDQYARGGRNVEGNDTFEIDTSFRKTGATFKTNDGNMVRTKSDSMSRAYNVKASSGRDGASLSSNGRANQPMNLKAAGAHARGSSTMTDTGRVSKQRSSKAMDALDRASSRKSAMQRKRPHQGQQQLRRQPSWQSNRSREGSIVEDERARNDASTDGVQLMMRTTSHTSKKRRHAGSSSSGSKNNTQNYGEVYMESSGRKGSNEECERTKNGTQTTESFSTKPGSKRRNGVTAKSRKKGNISSFFKPVVNIDV